MKGKPTRGGEESKCYMIWQMMMAVLHSNGQLRTENGDRQKGCQKPAVQQKILMTMMTMMTAARGSRHCDLDDR